MTNRSPGTGETFTDEELEELTEEERQGLMEGDEDEGEDEPDAKDGTEEENSEKSSDTEEDADDDDGDEEAGDDAAGEDADQNDEKDADQQKPKKEADADDDADDDDTEGDDAENDEDVAQNGAFPSFDAPANAKERLSEIKSQLQDLAEKFDDGELTAKEMRAQSEALEDERNQLNQALFKAEFSQEVAQDNWVKTTVPAFLAKHSEYAAGSPLYTMLDQEVRKHQTEALKNGRSQWDPAILRKAHASITTALETAGLRRKESKKPAGKVEKLKRELPPNLSRVPSSDITETEEGGQYAHLDRLTGEAYEDALAKLTPDQQDAYLSQR